MTNTDNVTLWDRVETVRHLRLGQLAHFGVRRVLGRLLPQRLPNPPSMVPALSDGHFSETSFLAYPVSFGFDPSSGSIRLLNIERDLTLPIAWEEPGVAALWTFELSYFHWLGSDVAFAVAKPYLIDWLDNAPHAPKQLGWGPYAVAQRVLMWTRLFARHRGELLDDPDGPRLLGDLHRQCRYLARRQEFEFLGNHLVKTATGLLAGGCFFAGAEAHRWRTTAMRILEREFDEQVLSDGGHYERTPMYHLLVLLDLLDALNMCKGGDRWRSKMERRAHQMTEFAVECADPSGRIPLLNDSAYDQAPSRLALIEYGSRVLRRPFSTVPVGSMSFNEFGLFRLSSAPWSAWVDGGKVGEDLLLAHAHADLTSVLLWHGTVPILVDGGLFCYGDHPARRGYDRGGTAHNVLMVNGHACCKCWKDFRVSRRPKRISTRTSTPSNAVTVDHDSFEFLPGNPQHQRRVALSADGLSVRDELRLSRSVLTRLDLFWHLAPGAVVQPPKRTSSGWSVNIEIDGIRLLFCHEGPGELTLERMPSATRFNVDEPGDTLHFDASVTQSVPMITTLELESPS